MFYYIYHKGMTAYKCIIYLFQLMCHQINQNSLCQKPHVSSNMTWQIKRRNNILIRIREQQYILIIIIHLLSLGIRMVLRFICLGIYFLNLPLGVYYGTLEFIIQLLHNFNFVPC